jgi:hypothetical protein
MLLWMATSGPPFMSIGLFLSKRAPYRQLDPAFSFSLIREFTARR